MNVLFLTLLDFDSIYDSNIYTDLLREFAKENHKVYVISPTEKRNKQATRLVEDGNCKILKLQVGNIQKTNILEKGISTLTLESKFKIGIKKYFSNIRFDLVIYTTPPITLQKAINYVKQRDGANTYLLLKDIFPQNAVDLGMLKKRGVKGLLYKYFRHKEKELYKISDYIGCMSEANIDYLLKHNPDISSDKVEVCPNSIEPKLIKINEDELNLTRIKYKIPKGRTTFIYGGNLGKPQGIDFLIECLRANLLNEKVYFIIVGLGTEFGKLKKFFDTEKPINAQLYTHLPKKDYEMLANSCDVGLIFLDNRFTIPNFPSRMLSYMEASMPILASTDMNTDVGKVVENGEFGLWCESTDTEAFNIALKKMCDVKLRNELGINARVYLEKNYTTRIAYEIIIKRILSY